jgi:hypothetical protein
MELNDGAVIVESLADPMRFAAIFDITTQFSGSSPVVWGRC